MRIFTRLLTSFLILAATQSLQADTIHLKNGRTVDGLIAQETDTTILLNVGVGTMTLKKSQIASIEKSDAAAQAKLKDDWKRHYFTNSKYTPKGFDDIASSFAGLEKQRQDALATEKTIKQLNIDIVRTSKELDEEFRSKAVAGHDMAGLSADNLKTDADVAEYNKVITRNNNLNGSIAVKSDFIQQSRKELDRDIGKTGDYIKGLDRFKAEYSARRKHAEPIATNDAPFFAQIDDRLKAYETELKRFDIAYESDGGDMVIQVRLNDAVTGRFIVDTGASTMSISKTMADRLRISSLPERAIPVGVADGRTVTAYPVMLDSVQVGEARAENIVAVIMDEPPGTGIDGLLGLTFLREFDYHYDAATRHLELIKFKP